MCASLTQRQVDQERGNKALLSGVCLQTAVTVPFMCVFAVFLWRHHRLYHQKSSQLPLHLASATSLLSAASLKDSRGPIALNNLTWSSSELTVSVESYDSPTARICECWTPSVIRLVLAVMVSSAFILVRCLYRIVEMSMGWNGFLNQHQYFFLFDSVPIALAIAVFSVYHPAVLLP